MKVSLYIDAKANNEFVGLLAKAHANEPDDYDPDQFRFLGEGRAYTVHGYEVSFNYLLPEIPAGLVVAPIIKIVLTGTVEVPVRTGIYRPIDQALQASVGHYSVNGRSYRDIRIETYGRCAGLSELNMITNCYSQLLNGQLTPDITWAPPEPQD